MIDSDLGHYRSEVVSADGTNGGRISKNVIPSGVPNNVWANAFKSERDLGSTKFIKVFRKANSTDNAELLNTRFLIHAPTPADDWVMLFAGTQTDTQADIVASARKYGTAQLQTDVSSDTQTLIFTLEDASQGSGNDKCFMVGDSIRVSNKATPDAATGVEEDLIIDTLSITDRVATATVTTPLINSYLAADTHVSSILEVERIVASTEALTISTTGNLTYDESQYPVVLTNRGAVAQSFTLTFLDATNFTVVGDSLSNLPAGNISTDYAAPNPDFVGYNYFELPYLAWGGTPVAGDTVTIKIVGAYYGGWEMRVIPPASGSLNNNKTTSVWNAESA